MQVSCKAGGSGDGPSRPKGFGSQPEKGTPRKATDALLGAIDEVAKATGRNTDTTNVVLGSGDEEEWRRLDEKVNVYPCYRSFTAIGKGGDEFTSSMVMAVVSVMGTLPPDVVKTRWSSSRSYTSVTVGPLLVQNVEEVMAIYSNMRSDDRLKYFL